MQENHEKLKNYFPTIEKKWDENIIPQLKDYIEIPNKSPMFEPNWKALGHMDKAMQLIVNWCKQQNINNMNLKLLEHPNRTPLLFIDIPANTTTNNNGTILLYGHMDKQPEMRGWKEHLGPWKAVLEEGKLYGRGGADDGYAVFAALTAIASLQALDIPHARCVILIEASEESGSVDLPYYLEQLKERINNPSLIICLDSDCGNYDQLWGTTSLRGMLGGTLKIKVLNSGLHSGYGSGVVPSTSTILRQLLSRIEDEKTGEILLKALQVNIPKQRQQQAQAAAKALGDDFYHAIGFYQNTQPITKNVTELILNRTWRPSLSIVGADGFPPIHNAGNVTLPELSIKLSMRIPPNCDAQKASQALKQALEKAPPFQASVTYTEEELGPSWHSPELSEWLAKANDHASQLFYNKPAAYLGGGGSIPFMGMLGEMFPQAQFMITGVLGPKSNAHGPNEFLHIDMVKKLTGCVASVIASHFTRNDG